MKPGLHLTATQRPFVLPALSASLLWLIGMVCTTLLALQLDRLQHERLQTRFDTEVQRVASDIERRFRQPIYGLNGVRGMYAATGGDIHRAEFSRYVASRNLPVEFPGVRGIGFIERVSHDQLASYIQQARADGAPDFVLKQPAGPTVQALDHYPIRYIYPFDNNRQALGLDVGAEAIRREGIERATQTGQATLSGVIHLVQDQQSRPGFLFYVPIYRNDQALNTPEQRLAALRGVAYSPIVLDELMQPGLELLLRGGLHFRLCAESAKGCGELLFEAGNASPSPQFNSAVILSLSGTRLVLYAESTPALEAGSNQSLTLTFALAGFVLSTLVALIVWLLATGRSRALAEAERLSAQARRLALVARETHDAVILTDTHGHIEWVNEGFTRITDYRLDEIKGQHPSELLEPSDSNQAALVQLRQVEKKQLTSQLTLLSRSKTGRKTWLEVETQPLWDDQDRHTGFMAILRDVTQRREAEQQLRRNEARFKHLSELSAEWFWETDTSLRFSRFICGDANRLAQLNERCLGRQPWEVEGLPLAGGWSEYQAAMERHQPIQGFEYRWSSPEGLWHYWMLNAAPTYDEAGQFTGYLGTGKDNSERHRTLRQLEQFQTVIENASDCFYMVDLDDGVRMIHVNEAAARHFGAPKEQIYTWRIPDWDPNYGLEDVPALIQQITHAHNLKVQAQHRLANGTVVPVEVSINHFVDEHGRNLSFGWFHNISKRLETEQLQAEARRRAESASQAKSAFLATMSHEIRTPMNAILGMLQLLNRTPLQPQQRDYVDKTQGAARSMLGLLNDILDFSKVEAGKMSLDLQPMALEQMLRDLSVIFSANTGSKPVELMFDIDPALPTHWRADLMRLQQVLINLGGNAIKFTEKGEVVLSIQLLDRGPAPDHCRVRFELRDTGIGIAPEHQSKIFSGFTQAENSTTRRFGGTGLGLAISQRLIELMGGHLEVESTLGQGSVFRFDLPLTVIDEPLHNAPTQADWHKPGLPVLVVDDHPLSRERITALCRLYGWEVSSTDSGENALTLAEERQWAGRPFRLCLIDWQMAGLSGWQTCQRLRTLAQAGMGGQAIEQARVLMVTSHGRGVQEPPPADTPSPVDAYLVKPITASMLLEAVGRALQPMGASKQTLPFTETTSPLAGLKLLVVEDNAVNQQVAEELLTSQGASVDIADNGLHGVEAVRTALLNGTPYDAVLMDMQMPVMDGLSATRLIRTETASNGLPIIAMTANALANDRQACLDAGMNDHIGKPFDLQHLVTKLLHWTRGAPCPDADASPSPLSTEPSNDTAIGLLDREAAMQRLGGNRRLLDQLSKQFLKDLPELLAQCAAASRLDSLEFGQRALHSLKGGALTIGAQGLAEEARKAESSCKSRTTPDLQPLIETAQATELALCQLGIHISEAKGEVEPSDHYPPLPAAQRERLERLLLLLQASDMDVFTQMEELVEQEAPETAGRWLTLDEEVQSMAFDAAAERVRQMLQG